MIDLRSDTGTRPTPAMRAAMAAPYGVPLETHVQNAPVGDGVYGENPTINALEGRVAALLGHEAALFVPSVRWGTNPVFGYSAPGQEIVCDSPAHIAAAVFSGITFRTCAAPSCIIDIDIDIGHRHRHRTSTSTSTSTSTPSRA